MRLLTTTTNAPQLKEFASNPEVEYAILSHRWREEEVTLQDLMRPDVDTMKGFAKLKGACAIAQGLGFEYLWMDTCCIDKTSSAELSEAINSMYMWYRRAAVCLAYLDDISGAGFQAIGKSIWFTRGWTLQELIAPEEVIFYNSYWKVQGTRTNRVSELESITGISKEVLLTRDMKNISVAQKMHWMSYRHTTRVEDQAYCLLGIFGINMPTIYGEGMNAFLRLQEEIIKRSDDQSIFAWGSRVSV